MSSAARTIPALRRMTRSTASPSRYRRVAIDRRSVTLRPCCDRPASQPAVASCGGSTGLAMCIWHAWPDRCGKFAADGKGTPKNGKGEGAEGKKLLAKVDKAG